jgi:hypothetical protein
VQTSEQTFLQLGSYPLLALLVRAIKYLGIYRHEALPTLGQAMIVLAKGALIVVLSIAEPLTRVFQLLPTTKLGGPTRHIQNIRQMGDVDCTSLRLVKLLSLYTRLASTTQGVPR